MNRAIKILSVCSLVLIAALFSRQIVSGNSNVTEKKEQSAEAKQEGNAKNLKEAVDKAKKEYEHASEANKKVPGTYPEIEIDRLKLKWEGKKSLFKSDRHVQYLKKVAALAKKEFEQAIEANKEVPGTYTMLELDRLKLESERHSLAYDAKVHNLKKALNLAQAKKEYERAINANKIVPGTFPQIDIDRLKLRLDWLKSGMSGDFHYYCLQKKVADLSKKLYEQAVAINKKVPGTYPQAEIYRLQFLWEKEKRSLRNDINVRFLKKSAAVYKNEYDKAIAANKKENGAFSQDQIERLKIEWERSLLILEHEKSLLKLQ